MAAAGDHFGNENTGAHFGQIRPSDNAKAAHAAHSVPGAPVPIATFIPLALATLLVGAIAAALTLGTPVTADNVDAAPELQDRAATSTRLITDVSPNPLTNPVAKKQAAAVRTAVLPIIGPYGDAVSVCYQPVGLPAGKLGIRANEERLSASMIKLLVLACLLDQADTGTVDLASRLTVARSDLVGGSGVISGEGAGNSYTLDELAYLMIAESDNVATNMLIDLLGVDAINAEGAKLGLSHTQLVSKMMADVPDDAPHNHTSAEDLARLLDLIATGTLVDERASGLALWYLSSRQLDEGLADGTPSDVAVAHKTGSLVEVVNDGGIVFAESPYVLVVLVQDLDNDLANELVSQIAAAAYAASTRAAAGA